MQQFWLMFENIVNEQYTKKVTDMKLYGDCVLFGNAKDFESNEIFDFITILANFFL